MKQFAVTLKTYLNAEDTEEAQRWVEKLLAWIPMQKKRPNSFAGISWFFSGIHAVSP